jgi:surface polysaccharide O-acyltransferase-like enzyme
MSKSFGAALLLSIGLGVSFLLLLRAVSLGLEDLAYFFEGVVVLLLVGLMWVLQSTMPPLGRLSE